MRRAAKIMIPFPTRRAYRKHDEAFPPPTSGLAGRAARSCFRRCRAPRADAAVRAEPDAQAAAGLTPVLDARPTPSQPAACRVATVNGVAVYRPLMRSVVSNPVDRALLISDVPQKRHGHVGG